MSRYTCPGTQSWPYFFEVSSVTPVDAPSGDFILRYEKRQKHFFLLTHQVMFQHTYICVVFTFLLFSLFIFCSDFHFMCPVNYNFKFMFKILQQYLLRFFTVTFYKHAKTHSNIY